MYDLHIVKGHLAANVRQIREHRGLTQAELAELIGVEPRAIRALEATSASPRLVTVIRIATELGVSIGALFRNTTFVRRRRGRPRKGPART